jgi:hypothetical protein
MQQPIDLSPRIAAALEDTLQRDAAIMDAGMRVFRETVYPPDLFVAAVLNRALQLVHGFVALVQAKNYLTATPLFRLQLDNALRLWAGSLVESFDVFTTKVLQGERIDKMTGKSGKKLTDQYLVETLAEHLGCPDLPTTYKYASGFIHLSGEHVFATNYVEDGSIKGRIVRADETMPEAKWLDLIDGFTSATDCVLNLVSAWAMQKAVESKKAESGDAAASR